jgi:hypothetical protein
VIQLTLAHLAILGGQQIARTTNKKGNRMNESELRVELETKYGLGNVWNTQEMQEKFSVKAFCAPYVDVMEKATRTTGSLEFTHSPRFYFGFIKD